MSRQLSSHIALVCLFVVSFTLLNWVYGYAIVYQDETNNCYFLFSGAFFRQFLDHPAAPVRYAGRFLGQFFYYRWLGALVVAAGVTCFGALFYGVLRKSNRTVFPAQILLPSLLLLALHTSTLWLLQDTLGLCAACLAFLIFLTISSVVSRRVFILMATVVVYFLAGGYVWVLVAWGIAHELLTSSRRSGILFSVLYGLLIAAMVPIVWRWIYMIPLRSILTCPIMLGPPFRTVPSDLSTNSLVINVTLAIALGLFVLTLPFWDRLFSNSRLASSWRFPAAQRSRIIFTCATVIPLALVYAIQFDGRLATVMACRQAFKQRDWDAVLKLAKRNRYDDHRVQFMTNFALCEKGELLDEMFRYPQPWGTRGLFMNFTGMRVASREEDDTGNGMYNSDLLFELGHANFSLRHAYNYITMQGPSYESMARMAECSIVNGNDAMANKYLTLLEQSLFYRDFARHHQQILADRKGAECEFGDIRSRLPTVDGFGHPTAYFVSLLESHPDNRLAFDYLMAWLMLDKTPESLESLCADIGHLRDVGRATIPLHCQEAMLLKGGFFDGRIDPQGFELDATIVNRFAEFQRDYLGQDSWLDEATALERYGDTYMYYWFFATPLTERAADTSSGNKYSATSREE